MKFAGRALCGAILSALIVLFVHPRSRPFVAGPLTEDGRDVNSIVKRYSIAKANKLPELTNLSNASLWLIIAADQELKGHRLSSDQAVLLAEIAHQGRKSEPDNAYWCQMESVFLSSALRASGQLPDPSFKSWNSGANLATWNDHQAERLMELTNELNGLTGTPMSWHGALSYFQRSSAVASRVLVHSRQILSYQSGALEPRIKTILNGALIRDGAKSIQNGLTGVAMMNLALSANPNDQLSLAPKSLVKAKSNLLAMVKSRSEVFEKLKRALDDNEVYWVQIPRQNFARIAEDRAKIAIICASLPFSLIVCAVVGLVSFCTGLMLEFLWMKKLLTSPYAAILGLLFGGISYWFTGLILFAVWISAVIASYCLVPDRLRTGPLSKFGGIYWGLLVVLALGVLSGLSIVLMASSVPSQYVGQFAVFPIFQDSVVNVPFLLAMLAISFVFATGSLWGYFYRFPATQVLVQSLKGFGAILAFVSLFGAILATPFCMAMDRSNSRDFSEMIQSEPNHYLVHPSR